MYQVQLCPGPNRNSGTQQLPLLMTLLWNHPLSPLGVLGRSLEERSKSDPGPAAAWGNGSTRPRGLCTPCWQLEHSVAHTQHLTSSKDRAPGRARLQVPTSLLLEGSILLLSPQQGCTALGSAAGAAGRLTPLLQSLDFEATERKRAPGSGIHVVPEHPRHFSPQQQALLVLCDRRQTGAQSNEYLLLEAKARDWGKDKSSEILI